MNNFSSLLGNISSFHFVHRCQNISSLPNRIVIVWSTLWPYLACFGQVPFDRKQGHSITSPHISRKWCFGRLPLDIRARSHLSSGVDRKCSSYLQKDIHSPARSYLWTQYFICISLGIIIRLCLSPSIVRKPCLSPGTNQRLEV